MALKILKMLDLESFSQSLTLDTVGRINGFQQGEVISASLIVRLLARHIDGLIVLDLHAPSVLDDLDTPVEFVSAMPEIAEHLKINVNPDFILSPDKERLKGRPMLQI